VHFSKQCSTSGLINAVCQVIFTVLPQIVNSVLHFHSSASVTKSPSGEKKCSCRVKVAGEAVLQPICSRAAAAAVCSPVFLRHAGGIRGTICALSASFFIGKAVCAGNAPRRGSPTNNNALRDISNCSHPCHSNRVYELWLISQKRFRRSLLSP